MDIFIEFLGARTSVTGSRTLLHVDGKKILVDCGLFQGGKDARGLNWKPFLPAPETVDAVILTHAHLDHSGFIPRFVKQGFNGRIHCSLGTFDLAQILLKDAAYLEEEQANYANKTKYSRHDPALPLFTVEESLKALELFVPHERHEWVEITKQVSFRFLNAGHIVGASMVQFRVRDDKHTRLITFSGDLGNERSQTIVPPENLEKSDILILESTYGNKEQPKLGLQNEFASVALRTFKRMGVLVIPAFAVGRAQEIIYMIRKLEDINVIPAVPVILDSPMAESATDIFLKHRDDQRASLFNSHGVKDFYPHHFEISKTVDDSMLACMREGPLVVISAAGMLNGGRILHHLKHRLPHPENTVLFSGYQAEGSKGRFLQDNAATLETLRIHHQEIEIQAEICTLPGLSSHADFEDTIAWLRHMQRKPSLIYLNHGTQEAQNHLAKLIQDELNIKVITTSALTNTTNKVKIF